MSAKMGWISKLSHWAVARLKQLFKFADADNDGRITREELRQMFAGMALDFLRTDGEVHDTAPAPELEGPAGWRR